MRTRILSSALVGGLIATLLAASVAVAAAPTVVWSKPNPSSLAGHVGGTAWAPSGTLVASGLSDRWVYIRNASNGSLVRSILQPPHSHGVVRLQFSRDSRYLAVGNSAATTRWRVYEVASGTFLGQITAAVDSRSIVQYGVDATLATAGAAGQLSNWRVSDLPATIRTGSGYDTVTTRFQLSPDGVLETALSGSTITVRRVSSGAVVATLSGQRSAFSPSSTTLATWTSSPNRARLYSTSTFALQRTITLPNAADSVDLAWTPAGNLVAFGYRPFLQPDGTWDQTGIIHFWSTAGTLLATFDQGLSLGVTAAPGFRGDGVKQMLIGVYDGTTVAAANPA